MKLLAIRLALLAAQAYAGMAKKSYYPMGGMFFTGNFDSLIKLRDLVREKGFVLEIITIPDGTQRLIITSDLFSSTAFLIFSMKPKVAGWEDSNLLLFLAPLPLGLSEAYPTSRTLTVWNTTIPLRNLVGAVLQPQR